VISISWVIVTILIIYLNLSTEVYHDHGTRKPAIWLSLELALPPLFPLLANTAGSSTFATERSKTMGKGMDTAIAATASCLTANDDDSKKVWPSLLPLFQISWGVLYFVFCFRTGLKGKFTLLSIYVHVLMNEKRCCQMAESSAPHLKRGHIKSELSYKQIGGWIFPEMAEKGAGFMRSSY
jgi:hypothetical protein